MEHPYHINYVQKKILKALLISQSQSSNDFSHMAMIKHLGCFDLVAKNNTGNRTTTASTKHR